MNKMKKLLVLVSLALVLGLVIGCQNDTPTPTSEPESTPTPEPTPTPAHVAVTGISDIVTSAVVNAEKTLNGMVEPSTATNKNIVWTTTTANASITNGKLTSTKAQKVEVTATIKDGTAIGTDYTKTFTIMVTLLPMVSIPQGEYEYQGTDGGTTSLKENKNVAAFLLGETEVTQKQWRDVMGTAMPDTSKSFDKGEGDNYPMYYVSWYDAIRFCNALSDKEGLQRVYIKGDGTTIDVTDATFEDDSLIVKSDADGYRLPTEVEWEYAAGHGGFEESDGTTPKARNIYAAPITKDDEPDGTDDTSGAKLSEYAVYGGNNVTPAVTSSAIVKEGRKSNPLGLYDMSGNVVEWCYEWITSGSSRDSRVSRGGSWEWDAKSCRVANRISGWPDNRVSILGFRLARSL